MFALGLHQVPHMGDIGENKQAWGFSVARCIRSRSFRLTERFCRPKSSTFFGGAIVECVVPRVTLAPEGASYPNHLLKSRAVLRFAFFPSLFAPGGAFTTPIDAWSYRRRWHCHDLFGHHQRRLQLCGGRSRCKGKTTLKLLSYGNVG